MWAWLPSLITLIVGILGQVNAADWVAAHPSLAMALATLGQLITAVTKSPMQTMSGGSALRSIFFLLCLVFAWASLQPAHAQTVTVDLNKSSLAWDWAKAPAPNDGDPEGFTAKCGKVQGVYNVQTPINDPAARTVPLRTVLNGQGVWFCVVSAFNRYGPSGNSNEVSFDAGAVPASPTKNRVQAN